MQLRVDLVMVNGTEVTVYEPEEILEFDLADHRRAGEMERLLRGSFLLP